MRMSYVEFLGRKYPLCFSMAASQELVEAFGSLDKMADALDETKLGEMAAAVDKILTILMKAGRIYAQAVGEDVPPELPCRPADLIDITDKQAINAIFNAMKTDSERSVEAVSKNVKATSAR